MEKARFKPGLFCCGIRAPGSEIENHWLAGESNRYAATKVIHAHPGDAQSL